ncbi:hypothetical protein [Micromonospora echinospora]|uniref:hypothetical protein n=1 Tax=Micromonospora echinospora TaxID=1877 RepID=UPI00366AB905
MRKSNQVLRSLALTAAAVAGSAVVTASPAQAATSFDVCGPTNYCSLSYTFGTITWYNRTAGVTGSVVDVGPGNTTAYFEAFAGSTKIDSQTRTADDETSLGSPRGFNFTIGDTNLVGGIDRIKITVCFTDSTGQQCGTPQNFSK